MDIPACAPGDAPWDLTTHRTGFPVNDTLLASFPVAASATHPHEKHPDDRHAILPMMRRLPGIDPRWGAHAAATAQVTHD
jgi:hypothetical protein